MGGGKIGLPYTRPMERHAPWFRLLAVALAVVGLLTLAAPAPVQAMDPQLIMAMASAAGALALITAYLIVANTRDKQRGATLEGIYFCGSQEDEGPMGCGAAPQSRSGGAASFAAAPESPMTAGAVGAATAASASPMTAGAPMTVEAATASSASPVLSSGCRGGQAVGPMGCDGGSSSAWSFSSSAPARTVPAP